MRRAQKYRAMGMYLPADVYDWVAKIARQEGFTKSAVISGCIRARMVLEREQLEEAHDEKANT